MEMKKRVRTENWTKQEKDFLTSLCKQYMNIIEDKSTSSNKRNGQKCIAWDNIYEVFSNKFGTYRSLPKIRQEWKRIKIEVFKRINTVMLTYLNLIFILLFV